MSTLTIDKRWFKCAPIPSAFNRSDSSKSIRLNNHEFILATRESAGRKPYPGFTSLTVYRVKIQKYNIHTNEWDTIHLQDPDHWDEIIKRGLKYDCKLLVNKSEKITMDLIRNTVLTHHSLWVDDATVVNINVIQPQNI